MKREPSHLGEHRHDLLIVGGGITGACLAFDAALRGLSVALVDKGDFGAATSAASSKLLHGGLRYLQQLRIGKVRESAAEACRFQNLAPHLTRWVPFVVPTYPGLARGRTLLRAGLAAHRLVTAGLSSIIRDPAKRPPAAGRLGVDEIAAMVPGLERTGITGGALFHESHMISSERMTLGFVDSATRVGATACNYVRVREFVVQGDRVVGVEATDEATGERLQIRARAVVNAAGPWIRELNSKVDGTLGTIVTGHSRGAHIVTRALTRECAVALPTRRAAESLIDRGGRHVFIIPWRGLSLIGTTYGPHRGDLDGLRPTQTEVDELLADINEALGSGTLRHDDVRHAFVGLYPLVAEEIDPAVYQGTGDYRVVDHGAADGVAGLFSVFGAKYTTARALAETALDTILASAKLDAGPCRTRDVTLAAGDIGDLRAYHAQFRERFCETLPGGSLDELVTMYGTAALRVAELATEDPWLAQPLADDCNVLAAEVIWAARQEMAGHLADVVFRRTGLGTVGDPGDAALERAATLMAGELGWDRPRRHAEIDATRARFVIEPPETVTV